MNDSRLSPEDPKLTAYALGELSGDERAAVESALRENPALRAIVDEIRATSAQLESALAAEVTFRPGSSPVAQAGIILELNGHAADAAVARSSAASRTAARRTRRGGSHAEEPYDSPSPRSKWLRFPQFYYVIATAAAACVAVVVALRENPRPAAKPLERIVRHEIVLLPPAPKPVETPSTVMANAPGGDLPVPPVAPSPIPSVVPARWAEVENARPGSVTAAATAFIDNLSLIGQAKAERDASSAAPSAGNFGSSRFSPREERARPQPAAADGERLALTPASNRAGGILGEARAAFAGGAAPTSAGSSAQGALSPGGIAAGAAPSAGKQVFFDTLTPPVAPPVVAATTPPSIVPNAPTRTGPSGGAAGVPGAGDVVVLSAFNVTADRAVGFATGTSGQRFATDKRGPASHDDLPSPPPGAKFGRNTEAYSYVRDNDFLSAAQNRLSTFSIDVDSASYANVRRIIEQGSPPPRDAVRIEELLNYFPYRYAEPKGDAPFATTLEMAEAPWAPTHRLVRIGLKAREVPMAQRPPASLVFLLDVSGSMNQSNKLPLAQQSLRLLVGKLRADDRVAIVTYAGNSGVALPSTPVAQSREILNALDELTPGGATNGATGIQLAYDIAKANFVPGGINRVILCTDGDFNVGPTSEGELVRLIEEKAGSGVFLTVLGFGMGNYKDATLEKLADKGNGNYGYIDSRREAEKLLVQQVSGTLVTVAKDVKIEVEFNPATVSSYRLIGYENRLLRKEDFNNDHVDAGEMGAGHTVTALYEVVPVGAEDKRRDDSPPMDELRYGARGAVSSRLEMPTGQRDPLSNELLNVKVRYKKPDSLFSFPRALEFQLLNVSKAFARASADFRFAAAVAEFGMILRGSPHRGAATMADVASWAAAAAAPEDDPGGYRGEFLELVRKAQTMTE